MGDQFDPTKKSHYIEYLDANNLFWLGDESAPSNWWVQMGEQPR